MSQEHFEPYLYLAGLTHDAALISWGGFFFKISSVSGKSKLVDDSDLKRIERPRNETIGARSQPYGSARVEVFDAANNPVAEAETSERNHVWIEGLAPDTEYTYRLVVDGKPWAEGELHDWQSTADEQGLVISRRRYENRFRTHPAPDQSAPLTFAIIGDFGVGVRKPSSERRCQRKIADALERAVDTRQVRVILTTGDNIYASRKFIFIPIGGTGDEDDDWFFTFYQPYRYSINRVPVYPCVGNHDSMETESSDDRAQLEDNFFINERFSGAHSAGPSSRGPGLFYRFKFGKSIEFVCIDSTRKSMFFGTRFFDHKKHRDFVEAAFEEQPNGVRWKIPFSHHPTYCAGPVHSNSDAMIARMTPRFRRAGVRAVFAGHEHNYQYSHDEGLHFFVTGSAGKVDAATPTRFGEARTVSWAATPHLLLVDVDEEKMTVSPIGGIGTGGDLTELTVSTPKRESVASKVVISLGD